MGPRTCDRSRGRVSRLGVQAFENRAADFSDSSGEFVFAPGCGARWDDSLERSGLAGSFALRLFGRPGRGTPQRLRPLLNDCFYRSAELLRYPNAKTIFSAI